MAQRTGADSLLAPRAKTASAGAIPALAVAALLALSGCGGGGGEPDATTAGAQGSQSTATQPGNSTTPSSSRAGKEQGAEATQGQAAPSPGAKQGPAIAVPESEEGRERLATPEEEAELTVADIALWSPALGQAGAATQLPPTYTCDGQNTWPPLRWQGVPAGTEELAIFAMSVAPVAGKLVFDWAVAGLDPSLEGIESGRLPQGAVSGQNSFGHTAYEICPQGTETYVFALFALPQRLSPRQGFDPHALRERILELSGNAGLLALSYSR